MENRKLNRRNLLLLLFVLAACVVGGRSIFGFFALLTGYETATTEVALVLGNMSFPNITIMSTVVMSKYIGDTGMYDFAISSPLLVSALRQPYLFYTYMVAEGLMIILACVTVYKYIVDKKKNSNYNNMYM